MIALASGVTTISPAQKLDVIARGAPCGVKPGPNANSYTIEAPGPARQNNNRRESGESPAPEYPNSNGPVRTCLEPVATEIATMDLMRAGPSVAISHCPSADQEILLGMVNSEIWLSGPPDAGTSMRATESLGRRERTKAMKWPSGDQAGLNSG